MRKAEREIGAAGGGGLGGATLPGGLGSSHDADSLYTATLAAVVCTALSFTAVCARPLLFLLFVQFHHN